MNGQYPWKSTFSPFIKELNYFESIYNEKSISRASERLSIDQGNLSKTLKKLEEQFQMKLFSRYRNGVKPTENANALYKALVDMKKTWEKAKTGAYSEVRTQTLNIGAHESVATTYLGSLLGHLNDNYQNLYPQVQFGTSYEITRLVQLRKVDLGIVVNPIKSQDLVIRNFATEEIELCGKRINKSEVTLIKNPEMIFIEKILKNTNFSRVIDISDYDVAASICSENDNFWCVVPSPVRTRNPKLKVIKKLRKAIPVKLITYPGSSVVGLLKDLSKMRGW